MKGKHLDKKKLSRWERYVLRIKRVLIERWLAVFDAADELYGKPYEELSPEDQAYLCQRMGCNLEHAQKAACLSLESVKP